MGRLQFLTLLATGSILLTGCGGPVGGDFGGPDGKLIADLIGDFDDLKNNPRKLVTAFAKGAVPAEEVQPKFRRYMFFLVGKPTVSGNTATATIAIEVPSTGDQVGERTWEFVKEGDAWKIKSAPLP